MSETEKSQQEPRGKSPEQIKAEVNEGKWPFAVSEEQMRADIAKWKSPVGEASGDQ